MRKRGTSLPTVALTVGAWVVLAIGGLSGTAVAFDGPTERSSHQHFQKGEVHYSAGRFAEALTEYQAGYDAVPLPGFLVNIAQCHRRLGDLTRARVSYQKFVLVAPDSPLIPEVRSLIAEIDRLMSESEKTDMPMGITQPSSLPEPRGPGGGNNARERESTVYGGPQDPAPSSQRPTAVNLPGVDVASQAPPAPRSVAPAITARRRWLLWGAIGAAVIAGSVASVALWGSSDAPTIHDGSLGTLRR